MVAATTLIETLSTNLGIPHDQVATFADALKEAGLFGSDGFASAEDTAHLLLAVMSGVSPENAATEVEAYKSLSLTLATETDDKFSHPRILTPQDPAYAVIPPTFGEMLFDAILQAESPVPTALRAAVHDVQLSGGPGTRRGNINLDGCLRLLLAYGARHSNERPDDAPPCRLDWSAHVPGRIFHVLHQALFPRGQSPIGFVDLEQLERL